MPRIHYNNISGASGYIRLYSSGGDTSTYHIGSLHSNPALIACLPDARTTVLAGSRNSRIRIVCCATDRGTSSFACVIAEIVCNQRRGRMKSQPRSYVIRAEIACHTVDALDGRNVPPTHSTTSRRFAARYAAKTSASGSGLAWRAWRERTTQDQPLERTGIHWQAGVVSTR